MKFKYIVFATSLLVAEPSVYSRAVTYSTSSSSSSAIYSLRQEVASLKEEVEGLKSIVESLSLKINQNNTPQSSSSSSKELEVLKKRVSRLESIISNLKLTQNRVSIQPKSEPTPISKPKPKQSIASSATSNGSIYDSVPASKLYIRGVRLFEKKNYDEAKRIFKNLLKRKYKLSATNFYLGEIAYKTGKYQDAINYYQQSAELNENAAYMDKLLLHTGISLEKYGDKEQAKKFYQAIIDAYPGTNSARIAKKRLK